MNSNYNMTIVVFFWNYNSDFIDLVTPFSGSEGQPIFGVQFLEITARWQTSQGKE